MTTPSMPAEKMFGWPSQFWESDGMNIRAVIKHAMGDLSTAELVRLLDGKVDKSSVYRFLKGGTIDSDKLGHIFEAIHLSVTGFVAPTSPEQYSSVDGVTQLLTKAMPQVDSGPYKRIAQLEQTIEEMHRVMQETEFEHLWVVLLWNLKEEWDEKGRPNEQITRDIDHALLTGKPTPLIEQVLEQRAKQYASLMFKAPPKRGRPPKMGLNDALD